MATTFTRWEYRTYSVFMEQTTRDWLAGLNELGDEGWEVTALSDPVNAKPRDPVASAMIWPMTPPWETTTTVSSRWAAAMRVMAPRTRAANALPGSAPGMTSQRCSANICSAAGWPSATCLRKV